MQAFFDRYYAPNNATLTVVGDFEPGQAKDLIDQYFGNIPGAEDTDPIDCEYEIGAAGGERRVWEDKLANLPAVLITFLAPEHRAEDTPALTLLSTILGEGESSRLNRSLVRDQQIALGSGTINFSRRGPGQFITFAIANQGMTPDTLEAALRAEVARIIDEGVTAEELEKARNAFRASDIFGRQTGMAIAEEIQHFVHFHDSVDEINTDLDRYMSVTIDDIRRVAARYLAPANSVVLVVVPKQETAVQP